MNRLLIAALMLTFLASCHSSSYITSSWRIENVPTVQYRKIVVLGMFGEADHSIRESMEQHIADDLKRLGFNAVCSCKEYNRKAFEGLNEQQVIEKLRSTGVDAVMTIAMLGKADEQYYIPPRSNVPAGETPNNRFWDYYQSVHSLIGTQGYYVSNTKYIWESNLYDIASGKLFYNAKSSSFDPASADKLGHEYGQMIIKNMIKKKVLAKP